MNIDWTNAPEAATHYDRDAGVFCCNSGYWAHDARFKLLVNGHNQWGSSRYILRPQFEWVNGLPLVGCECEFEYLEVGNWVSAKVIGYDGPACVVALDGYGYEGSKNPADFRTIRTKEQRQREDLADLISSNIEIDMVNDCFRVGVGGAVGAVFNFFEQRYNLEPKPWPTLTQQ